MSRTDIHRPGWVKEQDPTLWRVVVIYHQHWHEEKFPCAHEPRCAPLKWEREPTHRVRRSVECDLGRPGSRCHRWIKNGRNVYCGCRSCTGYYDRRADRRRDRRTGKADARRMSWADC